jgi:hypothetical protein
MPRARVPACYLSLAMTIKMSTDTAESAGIFKRYAAKLNALAALDRAYYATKSPSLAERTAYYQRQAIRERIRLWLYAESNRVRVRTGSLPTGLSH